MNAIRQTILELIRMTAIKKTILEPIYSYDRDPAGDT